MPGHSPLRNYSRPCLAMWLEIFSSVSSSVSNRTLTMGTAMSSAALVPRHSAIVPSLRAIVRMSATVDGCAGGLACAAAPLAALAPPPAARQPSDTGHTRQGGAWQLIKPHLLQTQGHS